MKEKDFQGLFGRWIKSYPRASSIPSRKTPRSFTQVLASGKISLAMELKLNRSHRAINFDRIEEHQLAGLARAEGLVYEGAEDHTRLVPDRGLFMKLSDLSVGTKPFDCFLLIGKAFVVCGWHERHRGIEVYAIGVREFLQMRTRLKEEKRASFHGEDMERFGGERLGRFTDAGVYSPTTGR